MSWSNDAVLLLRGPWALAEVVDQIEELAQSNPVGSVLAARLRVLGSTPDDRGLRFTVWPASRPLPSGAAVIGWVDHGDAVVLEENAQRGEVALAAARMVFDESVRRVR